MPIIDSRNLAGSHDAVIYYFKLQTYHPINIHAWKSRSYSTAPQDALTASCRVLVGADLYSGMSTTASLATGDDLNKPLSLLSLDAGGPQGVSQLLILKEVMNKLSNDQTGDSQGTLKRPCDVFDMIGGVGTGGLIAIFLSVFKMTTKEALDEFSDFVIEVFKDVDGDPRKQTERLTQTVYGLLNRRGIDSDAKLIPKNGAAPTCKLVVPVMYKSHVGGPCILRNFTPGHEPPVDLTIAEAMLATCSTPPIFTPTKIEKDFATFEYIGGDLGLSNPTREVISDAHRAFGNEATVACLLSIGCGHPGVRAVPSAPRGTPWIDFVERVAMDSERTAQDITTQMSQLTIYHRLSVNPGLETNQVREWKDPGLTAAHTTTYLNDLDVVEIMDHCVDAITHGDGFTTLEQLKHSGGGKVLPPPLPPLTRNYIERKLPMEFIDKALFDEDRKIRSGSKIIMVTGIGGCGKTQLTRKLIEKYQHLFESTFFINGSSHDTIKRDIVRHVRALGGGHSQESFEGSMIFLSQALKKGERLLVIDNVDDPALDLAPFLPRWKHGVVIVTSRDHSRGQLSPETHLQLDVMTPEESVELLIRGSGKPWPPVETDWQPATSVAEELGCHPIALVQAVSYMYNTGCSPVIYINLLRSNRHRLLRDHPATSQADMRYKTTFAAFDASYNILPGKARSLWHLLSFFQWRNFPVELITLAGQHGFSTDYPLLPRGDEFELGKGCLKDMFYSSNRWDPLELHSILATLQSHSLITLVPTENVTLLQMHPLVKEWGRLRISEGELPRFEAAAVRLLCCGASEDNYSMMQYLSGHVESLSFLWEGLHANDALSLGSILEKAGMYEKSATLGSIAHETVKRKLGPDHSNTTTTSANIARVYYSLGRFSEAEELLVEVLRQRRQQLGVDHPDTIWALAILGGIYHALGRYAGAEVLLVEVLRKRKQQLGEDHPDTTKASAILGGIYRALGRYAEAEELLVDVLKKQKQLLGVDHPDTISASAGLGWIYHALGRYVEAEELFVEVLRKQKQLLGVDHPDTISALAGLGGMYHGLGRYVEAEELLVEALRQRKQQLGVDHPDTIWASAGLGGIYHGLGRYVEAEVLLVEVLRQRREQLGVDHPDTIWALSTLGWIYHGLGRYVEAEELLIEVLRQRKQQLGVDHPDTIRASARLGAFYCALRRYAEAETLNDVALKKGIALLGERHPDTIHSMLCLAQTYNATQRRSEASSMAQKALHIALENLGEGHRLYQEISAFLASVPDNEKPARTRNGRFAPYKKRKPRA